MNVRVIDEPISQLRDHAAIPISFLVVDVDDVSSPDDGLGKFELTAVPVAHPWIKDYDAIVGEGPTQWAANVDVSDWGLISAFDGLTRIGGAIVVADLDRATSTVTPGRSAEIRDFRVAPHAREQRVGTHLFRACATWAENRGCTSLTVETQNVNVPASRFYQRMGCTLTSIDRFAYEEFPDEVRLNWSLSFEEVESDHDSGVTTE
jgi:ribosomal protein S18 acetylase RimI-like enzyme